MSVLFVCLFLYLSFFLPFVLGGGGVVGESLRM